MPHDRATRGPVRDSWYQSRSISGAGVAQMATNRDRLEALERVVGEMQGREGQTEGRLKYLEERIAEFAEEVEFRELSRRVEALECTEARDEASSPGGGVHRRVEELDVGHRALQGVVHDHLEDFQAVIEALKQEVLDLNAKLSLTMRAVGSAPTDASFGAKVKVPEPRAYNGARDARELENFLFDVEQYFKAARVQGEETKVTMATMYLTGDAKLWWRTKWDDIQGGRCTIETWADLKKELKAQFLPENVEYMARRQLRDLKHTGTVREYVKQFSALMLDIRDMSENDKLFYFMEGLKPWARTELQRQRVGDLSTAQAAAERLSDYMNDPASKPRENLGGGDTEKSFRGGSPKSGGASSFNTKESFNWRKGGADAGSSTSRPSGSNARSKPMACFLCRGPHRVAECPTRGKLSAMLAQEEPKKTTLPQEDSDSSEDEWPQRGALRGSKPIQRLCALRVVEPCTNQGRSSPIPGGPKARVSAMQLNEVAKRREPTPKCDSVGCSSPAGKEEGVPDVIPANLIEFRGKRPKGSSPRRAACQQTELLLGAKPPARANPEEGPKRRKRQANKGRRPPNFREGDFVLIKSPPVQSNELRQRAPGLNRKVEGPFKVLKRMGRSAYKILLPKYADRHPVLHVSRLKPFHGDPTTPTRSQPQGVAASSQPQKKVQRGVEQARADREVRRRNHLQRESSKEWRKLGDEGSHQATESNPEALKQKIEECVMQKIEEFVLPKLEDLVQQKSPRAAMG